MTSKAALCKHLLEGNVVNIKNGFTLLGITNVPREIGRSVERSFGVVVSRANMKGKSRYGQECTWVDYFLNTSEHNLEGIQKMKAYIQEQGGELKIPQPKKEKKQPVVFHNPLFGE